MSDAVILALIATTGSIVSALITAVVYIKLGHVATKIDGRMTGLLEAVEGKAVAQIGQARAEGINDGVAAEQSRMAEPQK